MSGVKLAAAPAGSSGDGATSGGGCSFHRYAQVPPWVPDPTPDPSTVPVISCRKAADRWTVSVVDIKSSAKVAVECHIPEEMVQLPLPIRWGFWPCGLAQSGLFLGRRSGPSGRDTEQPRGGAAQDRDPLVFTQSWRGEHEIDLRAGPGEWIVGPDHDLAGTAFGDQMAQRLGREHDGVEEELTILEIGGRLFLGQRADPVGEGPDHRVRPVGIGRQEAAAVRRADFQAGKAIERAFEDEMRKRDGGFEWIADRVGQQAAAAQPAARL